MRAIRNAGIVFAVPLTISFLLALGATAKAGDAKVFGEAFRVEGIGDKAMALCLEGDKLYAGAGSRLSVYDVSKGSASGHHH